MSMITSKYGLYKKNIKECKKINLSDKLHTRSHLSVIEKSVAL